MIIDRFYDWSGEVMDEAEGERFGLVMILYIILWVGGLGVLIFFTGETAIIYALILTVIFAEWAYISKVKRDKNRKKKWHTDSFVGYKIGYLLGTFPIVGYIVTLVYNYQKILAWLGSPGIREQVMFLLAIIGVILIIILYFIVNVKIGKKIVKDSQREMKKK